MSDHKNNNNNLLTDLPITNTYYPGTKEKTSNKLFLNIKRK